MKQKLSWENKLSRRERQVIEILLAEGKGTAAEIRECLPDPPSYSAVRALLRVMEEKGVLTHESDGPRYIYRTTITQRQGRHSILQRVLETLFNGSREQLIATLFDSKETKITPEELDRLKLMIEQAREKQPSTEN